MSTLRRIARCHLITHQVFHGGAAVRDELFFDSRTTKASSRLKRYQNDNIQRHRCEWCRGCEGFLLRLQIVDTGVNDCLTERVNALDRIAIQRYMTRIITKIMNFDREFSRARRF
jgi:hypothetical protein